MDISSKKEKCLKYYFETETKYYKLILQKNLFREWSIIKGFGGRRNNLGKVLYEYFKDYESALFRLEKLKKIRLYRKYKLKV